MNFSPDEEQEMISRFQKDTAEYNAGWKACKEMPDADLHKISQVFCGGINAFADMLDKSFHFKCGFKAAYKANRKL